MARSGGVQPCCALVTGYNNTPDHRVHGHSDKRIKYRRCQRFRRPSGQGRAAGPRLARWNLEGSFTACPERWLPAIREANRQIRRD